MGPQLLLVYTLTIDQSLCLLPPLGTALVSVTLCPGYCQLLAAACRDRWSKLGKRNIVFGKMFEVKNVWNKQIFKTGFEYSMTCIKHCLLCPREIGLKVCKAGPSQPLLVYFAKSSFPRSRSSHDEGVSSSQVLL